MTEEHKAKLKASREAKKLAKVEPKEDLRAELDAFKREVVEILKGVVKDEEDGSQIKNVPVTSTVTNLPENYQSIFNEYFDPADGFGAEISYDDNITFTIIVPMKFSNTTEAWRSYYKEDRRSKVLKQGNIEGGIGEWCEKVSKNLKYNKNLQTK